MQKPLRLIIEFPATAPFFRVSAMVRDLGKSGTIVAPAITLPDYDPDDEEQAALYNQLQQVGIPVRIPEQPEEVDDDAETDELREQWQTAMDQSKPESANNPPETEQDQPRLIDDLLKMEELAAQDAQQESPSSTTTDPQPE